MKLDMGLLRSDSGIKEICNLVVTVNALNDIFDDQWKQMNKSYS